MDIRILVAFACLTFAAAQDEGLTVSALEKPAYSPGGSVTIVCNVPDHTEPSWYHDGVSVPDSGRNKIENAHDGAALKSQLTISNLEASDAGKYKCATVSGFDDSNSVDLIIAEGAAGAAGAAGSVSITDPDDDELHVNIGEAFRLSCSADSGTKLEWQVDGKPAGNDFEVNYADLDTGATSMISKDTGAAEDSGVFKCVNEADANDSDEVTVHIAEKHDHPAHGEDGHEHHEGDEHDGHDHEAGEHDDDHDDDDNASSTIIASTLAVVMSTMLALL